MAEKIIVALNPTRIIAESPGGTMGQISFRRLAELFRTGGEITPREEITHFVLLLNDGVIQYRVESKP